MPKKQLNGSKPAEPSTEYKLVHEMLTEFRDVWVKQCQGATIDPMIFSRLSVVALTQLSAIVAVDVGMQPDQFTNICSAQFTEAYRKAPRFN